MNTNTEDLVGITEASNRGVSWLVSQASEGRTMVVLRNNQPAAVVCSTDHVDRLQRLDSVEEDLRLIAISVARMATDDGERFDLDEVAAEFGVDLDEDDGEV